MMNTARFPRLRPASGFTLIEVLIASVIGMVLLFATLSLFDRTNAAKTKLTRTNEVFQTGVFALQTLQSDLKLAGFYGEGTVSPTLPGAAPDICSRAAADWLAALRVPVQAWVAANTLGSCVPDSTFRVADSSIIAVRRAATCTVGSTNCSAGADNTPMVQVSQCKNDATQAMTGTTQASLTLKNIACTGAAPIRQYYTRIYYLAKDNVSGDGVGTLKRVDLPDNVNQVEPTTVTVAQGVQQMRLVYGIDSASNDGVPDVWTSTPSWAQTPNIVVVKINLLMKGTDPDPKYTNTRAYAVGDVNVAAANDNYYRSLVTATVRLPNVAGLRE